MRQALPLLCVPLLALAVAVAIGCAGRGTGTVEMSADAPDEPPDVKGFEILATKFLTATDPAERARCVEGGEELRDEMAKYYADRPPVQAVRVEAAKLRNDRTAVVVAVLTIGSQERRVVLALTKRNRAWLVDWKATLSLGK
jgi:hypothetical protein